MAQRSNAGRRVRNGRSQGITALTVRGFKSLWDETHIEVRPLTILAGANSSGKSSVMQPLLMLKQTLDAVYDPGPLLLDGPNVRFTSAKQMFARRPGTKPASEFRVGVEVGHAEEVTNRYRKPERGRFDLIETSYKSPTGEQVFRLGADMAELEAQFRSALPSDWMQLFGRTEFQFQVQRDRGFLTLAIAGTDRQRRFFTRPLSVPEHFERLVAQVIHVPGLRGNPERTYKTTSYGDVFQGTFENYVASIIYRWQTQDDAREKLLGATLQSLGLTWKVHAKQVDDTRVEIQVGRLPHGTQGGAHDTVSIADAGFGLSQTLPVVVALLAAQPGQLVYLEQPEIHLHPRAQLTMAKVLADAAKRGVRVVAETHSSLLLLGVQAAVAEGYLEADVVKLHWFKRDDAGATHIASADLDSAGTFGEWPEDFGAIELEAESRYLDLVETRTTPT